MLNSACNSVRLYAPAKLNLFLEVLGKRADGFHEIESLITAIDIFDVIELRPSDSGAIDVSCTWSLGWEARSNRSETEKRIFSSLPRPRDNLVYKALTRLREAAGVTRGIAVRIWKSIPSEAGLGGASSDAVAALQGANRIWNLGWTTEALSSLSAELGSDLPFFFSTGAAICTGRGETTRSVPGTRIPLVVVKPPAGLSTADVYRNCRPAEKPRTADAMADALRRGSATSISQALFNRLETAAEPLTPWIARTREALWETGSPGVMMTGSGTCCFGVYRTDRQARRAAAYLRHRNIGGVYAAATRCANAN